MLHSITILERDPVIAQDIGETLAEVFPDVSVSLFSTLRDLCDALIGFHVDNNCPPDAHIDDWDLDGLEEALRERARAELGSEEHWELLEITST